jgi:hypothetical protein
MPRGEYANVEHAAIEIIRAAEQARGWEVGPQLGQRAQRKAGCDLLSTPPGGGPPHPVEVKGWGAPLIAAEDSFSYPAEVNGEQYCRAKQDPNWRLEIVANLTAFLAGTGQPERLTLTGAEVVERAYPRLYRVTLDGLADRVTGGQKG